MFRCMGIKRLKDIRDRREWVEENDILVGELGGVGIEEMGIQSYISTGYQVAISNINSILFYYVFLYRYWYVSEYSWRSSQADFLELSGMEWRHAVGAGPPRPAKNRMLHQPQPVHSTTTITWRHRTLWSFKAAIQTRCETKTLAVASHTATVAQRHAP